MNSIVEDILMHYGMPRRSGRYPYGSGENPYQHSGDFLSRVQELKKSGMSETDIAKNMGLTTTQLRTQMSLAKDERRALLPEVPPSLQNNAGGISVPTGLPFRSFPLSEPALRSSRTSTAHWPPSTARRNTTG